MSFPLRKSTAASTDGSKSPSLKAETVIWSVMLGPFRIIRENSSFEFGARSFTENVSRSASCHKNPLQHTEIACPCGIHAYSRPLIVVMRRLTDIEFLT